MTKYGNRKTEYGGELFDSRGEAEYARRLDLLKAAGEVDDWRRGTPWLLLDGPRPRDRITYTPDFEVVVGGALRCVDFKGYATDVFRLKAKLWRHVYPDVPLVLVRADGSERWV